MESALFNQDYHVFRKENNLNRLFSSFSIFKVIRGNNIYKYEQRPPYPVLIGNPTFNDVLMNINKSDFVLYAFMLGLGINNIKDSYI